MGMIENDDGEVKYMVNALMVAIELFMNCKCSLVLAEHWIQSVSNQHLFHFFEMFPSQSAQVFVPTPHVEGSGMKHYITQQ